MVLAFPFHRLRHKMKMLYGLLTTDNQANSVLNTGPSLPLLSLSATFEGHYLEFKDGVV